MKQFTVTIGIPAYNEEANIGNLLDVLLRQKGLGFRLKEIIVVSDGSTDKTDQIILSFHDPRITFLKNITRIGQQESQNIIIKRFDSDILVFIEADTIPASYSCIAELIRPFTENRRLRNLGMVVGNAVPVKPNEFFESIMYKSQLFRQKIFNEWKEGINVYVARGQAMKALIRGFAKVLHWPKDVPEDVYAYFRLKELGFTFARQSKAQAYMRNVSSITDRLRQSNKFHSGKRSLSRYFPQALLKSEYTIPRRLLVRHALRESIKNPLWFSLFLLDAVSNRIVARFAAKEFDPFYKPYFSSKRLFVTHSS